MKTCHLSEVAFGKNNIFCILGNIMTSIWQRWLQGQTTYQHLHKVITMPGHLIDAAFEKTTYHAMYVKYNARTPKHLAEKALGKTTYQHLHLRHYGDPSFCRYGIQAFRSGAFNPFYFRCFGGRTFGRGAILESNILPCAF